MKEWNFTFDDGNGDWGWNSVYARGKKSAIKKAHALLKGFSHIYVLDEKSINTNKDTYKRLLNNFD